MPAGELRRRLERYAAGLEEMRDRYRERHAKWVKDWPDSNTTAEFRGLVDGYELALSALHIWTGGEYGIPLEQQQAETAAKAETPQGVAR